MLAQGVKSEFALPQVSPQVYLRRLKGELQVGKRMMGRLKSLGGAGEASSSITINEPSQLMYVVHKMGGLSISS